MLRAHFEPVRVALPERVERVLADIDQGSPIAQELIAAVQGAGDLVAQMVAELQSTQYTERSQFDPWEHRRRIEAFMAVYVADMKKAEKGGFFAVAEERRSIMKFVSRVFKKLEEAIGKAPGVLEIELRGAAWDREMAEERKIMNEHYRLQEAQISAMKAEDARLNREARDRKHNHERRMAAAGIETDQAMTERLRKERDQKHRDQRISQ